MISIHLNSLNFSQRGIQDCTLYVAISNPTQNTAVSEPVEYSKKDNMALFSEILYLKDSSKSQNKEDYGYLIIEVHEKYPKTKIIAQKTFSSLDIFTKKEVNLKTSDGNNEVQLHLIVKKEANINQRGAISYQRASSTLNCVDESVNGGENSLIFNSPANQNASSPYHNIQFSQQNQIQPSQSSQNNQINQEGSDQFFNGIFSSIKKGFLQLCEKETEKELDYLDMNQYMYQFVSKLGPVVAVSNYLREVFNWTNITQTLVFGISSSIMIFYPKFIIILGLLFTYFFTSKVLQFFFQLGVVVPQDSTGLIDKNLKQMKHLKNNMIFLQEQMRFYSSVYDQFSQFLFSDDKTQVIRNIQKFKNYSIFLVVGMIIISFEAMLFISLWLILIGQTSYGKVVSAEGFSLCDKLAHHTNRFIENEIIVKYLPKVVASSLQIPEKKQGLQKVVKKFIIQENQRWWIGKGWVDLLIPGEIPKWSDLQGKKELKKEDFKLPDQNWQWENKGEWVIEKSKYTDDEGWQYGKAFKDQEWIKEQKSLYYIRKRVWFKTCSTIKSYYDHYDHADDIQQNQNIIDQN